MSDFKIGDEIVIISYDHSRPLEKGSIGIVAQVDFSDNTLLVQFEEGMWWVFTYNVKLTQPSMREVQDQISELRKDVCEIKTQLNEKCEKEANVSSNDFSVGDKVVMVGCSLPYYRKGDIGILQEWHCENKWNIDFNGNKIVKGDGIWFSPIQDFKLCKSSNNIVSSKFKAGDEIVCTSNNSSHWANNIGDSGTLIKPYNSDSWTYNNNTRAGKIYGIHIDDMRLATENELFAEFKPNDKVEISLSDVFMPHIRWDITDFQEQADKCGYKYLCWNDIIYDTKLFRSSFIKADVGLTIQGLK